MNSSQKNLKLTKKSMFIFKQKVGAKMPEVNTSDPTTILVTTITTTQRHF
ncbi:hypothetical protein ACSBL2_04780 [Pedobacter sp. AW31-3R]